MTITKDAVSGQNTIAVCTSTATLTLGTSTYDPTDGRYEYANVAYSGLSACAGYTIKVTAADSSNAALASASGTVANPGSGTLSWDSNPPVATTTHLVLSVQNP